MKNLICLFSICLFFSGLQAQNIDKNKIAPVSKRQIEIDTREIEQFEEQNEAFFKAMESKDKKQVDAAKQMIQETMLREIKQSEALADLSPEVKAKVVTKNKENSKTPSGVTYTLSEARNAETSRRQQQVQQRTQKANNQRVLAKNQEHTNRAGSNEQSEAQKALYQEFVSIKFDSNNQFQNARMSKLLMSFAETLEQDLEKKKKQLSDQY